MSTNAPASSRRHAGRVALTLLTLALLASACSHSATSDRTAGPAGPAAPATTLKVTPEPWAEQQERLVRSVFGRARAGRGIAPRRRARQLALAHLRRLAQVGAERMASEVEDEAYHDRARRFYGSAAPTVDCWWDGAPEVPIRVREGRATWRALAALPTTTGFGVAGAGPWLVVCVESRAPAAAEIASIRRTIAAGLDRYRRAHHLAPLTTDPTLDRLLAAHRGPGHHPTLADLTAAAGSGEVPVWHVAQPTNRSGPIVTVYANPENIEPRTDDALPWAQPWTTRVGIDVDPATGEVAILAVGHLDVIQRLALTARLSSEAMHALAAEPAAGGAPTFDLDLLRTASAVARSVADDGCVQDPQPCLERATSRLAVGQQFWQAPAVLGSDLRAKVDQLGDILRTAGTSAATGVSGHLTPEGAFVLVAVR